MADKALKDKEILLTEGSWRIVRSYDAHTFRSYTNPEVTPPYYEHFCEKREAGEALWLWFIPTYRDLDVRSVCLSCRQQPTDGMVVMMRFLVDDERLAD